MTSPKTSTKPLQRALLAGGLVTSLGLFVFGVLARGPRKYFDTNELPMRVRATGVGVLLGVALVSALVVLLASRGERASKWQRRLNLASPLLVVGALPPLLSHDTGWSELTVLVYLGVLCAVFERLLRTSLGEASGDGRIAKWLRTPRPRLRWVAWVVLGIAIAYYVVGVSYWTIASHQRFETRVSDLAEFDNLFYNALRGHPFRSPTMTGRVVDFATLAHHAHLSLYLLLPVYALRPGPETLLVLQALLVGTTAIPVFLLARNRLGDTQALIIAFVFLVLPVVAQPNFYDFHFTALGLHLSAWLIYVADRVARSRDPLRLRTWIVLTLIVGAVLLVREEYGVGVAFVGLVMMCVRGRAWVGFALCSAGALYFVGMKFAVMPRFGRFDLVHSYATLVPQGLPSFRGVLYTLVSNPWFVANHTLTPPKLQYLLHFSVPLVFLWWRRPWLLTAVLPGLAFTFLATDRPPYFSTGFQYSYFFLAYVVAAAVYGAESLRPKRRRIAALSALLLASAVASFQFGALLGSRQVRGGFYHKQLRPLNEEERTRLVGMRELVAMIPKNAAVAATETEGPHASTRLDLFSIKLTAVPKEAEYVLAAQNALPAELDHVAHVVRAGEFGVEAIRGPFVLLRRGADRGKNDVALRMIAR